ncbi:hypothetical protein RGCCGE502_20265 [Rhizobium grahamii CCGE 502]|uniref:Uncharacterized protein n=2 Tax=Rhizobium grahamii TaxID=1120045 RepID=S3HCW1_9HYPH|nr:hypothetical protein RGCCGE502_20265 [Rhizobium grahamii CCGE 502]
MDLRAIDLFKHGYASFMMRRPSYRRHADKAPRLRDLFELYARAVLARDQMLRGYATPTVIEAKTEACVGLEHEIGFFLEHTAGSHLVNGADQEGSLPGAR